MLNATLKQYTWDELMTPFGNNKPITDDEFTALMAPTNSDTSIDNVPLTAFPMRDPAMSGYAE
ncbi:MAG: hypothetical protein Q7T18_08605 [Sedimentisphaerales bacterium]|nr:hypothetical protein [Sedimentisphaerales bacterium]